MTILERQERIAQIAREGVLRNLNDLESNLDLYQDALRKLLGANNSVFDAIERARSFINTTKGEL